MPPDNPGSLSAHTTLPAWCLLALLLCATAALIPHAAEAALSRTSRGANEAMSHTVSVGAFTPNNNSLLVAFAGCLDYEGALADTDLVVSGGSLSWTRRVAHLTVGNFDAAQIWTAPVTTGASMSATQTSNSEGDECSLHIVEYTGHNLASPIGTTGKDGVSNPGGGPWSFNLDTWPAPSSEVFAGLVIDNSIPELTKGTGWTELYRLGSNFGGTNGNEHSQSQVRRSSVSSNVLWDNLAAVNEHVGVAIEIKSAAGRSLSNPPTTSASSATGASTKAPAHKPPTFQGGEIRGRFQPRGLFFRRGRMGSEARHLTSTAARIMSYPLQPFKSRGQLRYVRGRSSIRSMIRKLSAINPRPACCTTTLKSLTPAKCTCSGL